ncbi:putative transcriptional regulator [Apibacter mensalis]|uniref:Putative transcriptional regulator n=1 Tax=Apibacter mensalis TaxID=1586267 RepID=A0A0X3ANY7_9FLAO|nr:YqgE/AlgH family protein [Apibacter mensalis]CVK16859.1 putative transcriptional regulator [Apibacter mensalis]
MNYKGKLLISKPISDDSFFSKSVVFITDYDLQKGAIGFILTKIYHQKLSDLVPDIDSEIDVYIGGPVDSDHIFVIHSRPDLINDSISINEKYYWSGDFEDIKIALQENLINTNEIRFFIGYSGWKAEQLENEIKKDDWLVKDNEDLNVLIWDNNLWKKELIRVDKKNIIWINSPKNPKLN